MTTEPRTHPKILVRMKKMIMAGMRCALLLVSILPFKKGFFGHTA